MKNRFPLVASVALASTLAATSFAQNVPPAPPTAPIGVTTPQQGEPMAAPQQQMPQQQMPPQEQIAPPTKMPVEPASAADESAALLRPLAQQVAEARRDAVHHPQHAYDRRVEELPAVALDSLHHLFPKRPGGGAAMRSAACTRKRALSASFHAAWVGGKCRPISPSANAP